MGLPTLSSRRRFLLAWATRVIVAALACLCFAAAPTRPPVVILVSIDGWRWDYIDRAPVPHLKALAARGVRATELIPSYPSLTFPNHYTLATGLYPAHHGIVTNEMLAPDMARRFTMSSDTARDPRWWGGEPIWVTAVRQGRRAATMFWPGSEVAIGGVRPTYWTTFDGRLPNSERIAQVLRWLALPDRLRPSFIALYFNEVDHAGHIAGPDSPAPLAAAASVDASLGQLIAGVRRLGMSDRTDIVVVSDHGMSQLADDRVVLLDDYIDPESLEVTEWEGGLHLRPRNGDVASVYTQLHGRVPHVSIYRREELPAELHYSGNDRIAPIIGLVDDGWIVTSRARVERRRQGQSDPMSGTHGYDPRFKSMHALFVAAGPQLKRGLVVPPFQNIHVYDLICALLHIQPSANDGDAAVTRPMLAADRSRPATR